MRSVSAYFGDLKDGVHTGGEDDPRVSIIEVVPQTIRYWVATQGTITRGINEAVSAVTGSAAAPGELRTITKEEVRARMLLPMSKPAHTVRYQIQLTEGLHRK